MALKKLPYRRLQHLIGLHLSTREWAPTQEVINDLAVAKKRGYLTKPELVKVCRWKSARAIKQISRNHPDTIRNVTRAAFATRSERAKLSLLIDLYGVSVPMASAILMLTNPKRYGAIDIRVWQLLYKMGSVKTNADGVGFDFKQWHQYLSILRSFAKRYKVGARDIERTLFTVHTLHQNDRLYDK